MYFCDTAGSNESRGLEYDISNSINITSAIKMSGTAKVVLVIS